MTSVNPWFNLIEVPEVYSGTPSRTHFIEHWSRNHSLECAETLRRPILVEKEEVTLFGEYFIVDIENETKQDDSNWIVVNFSGPTLGDITRYALNQRWFQHRQRFDSIAWGTSIESECPWIQMFGREFGFKSSVGNLKRMFSEVSRLVEGDNFEQVDRILRLANPRDYNLDFATGLLRATFIYRSRLPSWKSWLRETEGYLTESGEDAKTELAGLKQ